MTENRIVLDYTNRDFVAIRAMLVGLAKGVMPDWQTVGEAGDFGTLLLELYAYASDVTNYYVDRMASEAFLGTAVRRQSVLYIADMMGYSPIGQRAGVIPVTFTWEWDLADTDGPATYEYRCSAATVDNGVVSLTLHSADTGIAVSIVDGQTITVQNLDLPSYDAFLNGTYVVTSVVQNALDNTAVVRFSQPSQGDVSLTAALDADTDYVTTGSSIVLPALTKLFSEPLADGSAVQFETNTQVILNSAEAVAPVTGSTTRRVTKVTSATEGVTVVPREIGTSQGIPNAEYIINNPGVVDGTVTVYTVEGGQSVFWSEVNKLTLAAPTQSVFVTYVDDNNFTHVVFGDNSSGRIPPVGARVVVGYRYGSGAAAGNVPINAVVNIDNAFANRNGVQVTNTAVPVGGTDMESIESMRFSIPRAATIKQRGVTVDDFVALALQARGITKAIAYGSNYTAIYIRVASDASSQGYLTPNVLKKYLNTTTKKTVLLLDATPTMNVGQDVYVANVDADLDGTLMSVDLVSVAGTALEVTDIERTSNVLTVTTDLDHNFQQGQPINLTITTDTHTVSGYGVVLNVTPKTFTIKRTGGDFVSESVTDGLVATANGIVTRTPDGATPVTEFADPTGAGVITYLDGTMDILINGLEAYLSDKKLFGSVVYGEPVVWSDVVMALTVNVRPLFNQTAVTTAVQAAVENVFAYDNVDFGQRISVGDVYRAALAVDGVDYLNITKMYLNTVNVLRSGTTGVRSWTPKASLTNGLSGPVYGHRVSNVVTLSVPGHGFLVGDEVVVDATDNTYDGTFTITGITANTITYAQTAGDDSDCGTGTVAKKYSEDDVVGECGGYWRATLDHTVAGTVFDDELYWESWSLVGDIVTPAYNLPRLASDAILDVPWVTGTGGLVNT